MDNIDKYLADLKEEMRIAINRLSESPASNNLFKKSSFELLARAIISELKPLKSKKVMEIGKSISWETIREILQYNYVVTTPIGPKVYKTLSKICIYLGYSDWYDFIKQKRNRDEQLETKRNRVIIGDVYDAISVLNQQYKTLPIINWSVLREYFEQSILYHMEKEFIKIQEYVEGEEPLPELEISDVKIIEANPKYAEVLVTEKRAQNYSVKIHQMTRNVQRGEKTQGIYHLYKGEEKWTIYGRYYTTRADYISPLFVAKPIGFYTFDRE